MIIPATAGPSRRAPLTIEELMAMALPRSRRSSTICTRKAWRAGMSKALTRPCTAMSTVISARLITPASVSAPISSACSARIACVHSSSLRRLRRSTQTPANGPIRNEMMLPVKLTSPSSSAELVSRYTSHPAAMRVIQVPISEMPWPAKYSWKLRCRSARQACATGGTISPPGAGSVPRPAAASAARAHRAHRSPAPARRAWPAARCCAPPRPWA